MKRNDMVVVAGFGQAADTFVSEYRAFGGDEEILVVGDEPLAAYERPPLSKQFLTAEPTPPFAHFRHFARYAELGIQVRMGLRVSAIDVANARISLSSGETIAYGALVIATGARARSYALPGTGENALVLRGAEHAAKLRSSFRREKRLLVIGAGFLGLEIAAAARACGMRVSVVELCSRCLGRSVSQDLSGWIAETHIAAGVDLHLGASVVNARRVGAGVEVELDNGCVIEADLVVAAIGAIANDELAREAGIECADGILVDETGHSSHEHVYAIGDVARYRWFDGLAGVRLESWSNAIESAKRAAASILGRETPPTVPWFWTDQYSQNIQVLGLHRPVSPEVVWRCGIGSKSFARFECVEGRVVYGEMVNNGALRRPVENLMKSGCIVSASVLADQANRLRDV